MTTPTIDHTTGEILEDTIELARRQLGVAVTELHHEALIADQPADLARALAILRDLKQDSATIYSEIEQRYLDSLPDYAARVEVPGLGLVETHRRTKRKAWDMDALVADVIESIDTEGEGAPGPHEVTRHLRECISFGAGKVTGLRARGLQPDEYCQETPDGWSVQLPPRDHTKDAA